MSTTNLPNGVTNAAESTALGSFVAPDPSKVYTYWNDFTSYIAPYSAATDPAVAVPGDFVVSGTGTVALASAANGILTLTNDATDDHNTFLQWGGNTGTVLETFRWSASKEMWFKARFKTSDASDSDVVIGLAITDTSPLDASDGLFFLKSDGSTTINFKAVKNATASTVAAGTMVSDTYCTVGYHWSKDAGVLEVFFNDVKVGSLSTTTNFPDDEDIAVTLGIQNGAAAAKALSVDYIMASIER
ncbi:MAG TPA: hypothetical protein VHE81_06585 [Lacipirellulaceae bacterium]|jgi:hypothetical protein|nr:hypothetical protein [Lacipirellulaceae bacterium]